METSGLNLLQTAVHKTLEEVKAAANKLLLDHNCREVQIWKLISSPAIMQTVVWNDETISSAPLNKFL
jgi:hypothetical protein